MTNILNQTGALQCQWRLKHGNSRTQVDNICGESSTGCLHRQHTRDAAANIAARMGYGTPSVAEDVDYTLVRWSLNYWLMITLFRNHWIARKGIEIPAADATKAWPRLRCSLTPQEIDKFNRTISRTLTQQRVKRAITFAT